MPDNNNTNTKPEAPELDEIATTKDGRDITRGYSNALDTIRPSDSILKNRGAGNYRIYKEVLRDEQVMSTFQQRRLAVIAREYEVVPASNGAADKAAADFIAEQLEHIRFDAITDKMLFGIFYGFAAAECMWKIENGKVMLDAVKVRDRDRFAFNNDNELLLKTTANPNGEALPERKFWSFHTGADHDDEPYGMGLAHWLYWPTFFKRHDIKFWLIFLEKFGQPTTLGRYPHQAEKSEQNRLLQTLSDIGTDSGVIVPETMQIELLEAARSGTADYTSLYDRMDKAIAKVVIGQTASSEGSPGRLGNDDLQQDVRLDLIKADADLVCESFNNTVIKWLTEWNFPNATPPKVWRRVEDVEDLNKAAERDEKLFQIGFKPTLKHIQAIYGGDYVEVQPPAVSPTNTEFAEAHSNTCPCCSSTAPSFAPSFSENADTVNMGEAAWVEKIRTLIDEADNLEQIKDGLLTLAEQDNEDMQELMALALSLAELKGRNDVLDEAGL